jgi:hypothetical protein
MSCSGESFRPVGRIDVTAGADVQADVIDAVKAFGEKHGFDVSESQGIAKEGRMVAQVDLHRADGLMVTLDNFLRADVLTIAFYAKRADADWQGAKEDLRRKLVRAVGDRGKVKEIPTE